jgi:hypothetical protein
MQHLAVVFYLRNTKLIIMRKQIYTLLLLMSVSTFAGAQAYGELDWQKKKIPAMITPLP